MFRPIVILAEADYGPLQEFNLKQGYAEGANYYVLGHYAIVAAWAEHEEFITQGFGSIHTRWKFAFQYIEGNQGPPWWLQPPGTALSLPEPPAIDANMRTVGRRRNFGRQKWQCWECLTCGLKRDESRPQTYDSSCLLGPMDCETQGGGVFSPHDMKCTSRVVQYHDGYRLALYYELPDNVGRIVHVLNNPNVTQVANRLFQQYQEDASTMNMFQRHAMKTHGVKGELYAQHYSHNAGAPYKYIAEAISTPFEYCPQSVVGAKDHIQYLCAPALDKSVNFNEVLSVAYAEGQEMNFHSDDEPGLGPVVAGLTLGSHAEMLFRYHIACKKNLIYKNGPFRPSEARTSDDMDSNDRVLQIALSHGDLLIMDGAEIQKQYEHAVFVRDTDMVRFAATARLIDPRPRASTTVHENGDRRA
ncbi:hypothetical protein BN14_03437 [Rhizoctonia solani AG-1 IB]|uniref:Alpha-ketoglutarate-dependent dioxygenase AlkB-like domain-containing protein n=2 Tax=Rhizoctonia solani TaxID=456999 RepID=A0A8H2WV08_9AGAM|nr:unnamed protein product [Rhizoctonia solani]CCO29424.1 hypothetical protein BN14_03437 [Rhizoctonia solani AG-1 IB]